MIDLGDRVISKYIDLLKKSLINYFDLENGMRISYLLECMDTYKPYQLKDVKNISDYDRAKLISMKADLDGQENYRERIFGFPATMIGISRLNNIQFCIERIQEEKIKGDFLETGVWRGGATIFMKALLDLYQDESRVVWVADSFKGLPKPELEQDKGLDFYLDEMLSVNLETVKENFRRYGFLDEKVKFLEGWFKDTMLDSPIKELSLLRLDGDLYKSTQDVLINMYGKLSSGGFVIIDDYGAIEACRKATDDFRRDNLITTPLESIDWTGYFWRKE